MIEIVFDGVDMDASDAMRMRSAMQAAFDAEGAQGDACLMLTTPEGIRALNRSFRKVDAVTDVLSFPSREGEALAGPEDGYLGDVALCVARAEEQAAAYGHSLGRELAFLCVHGALHLLGYDHMEPAQERAMFARQEEILNGMGLTR